LAQRVEDALEMLAAELVAVDGARQAQGDGVRRVAVVHRRELAPPRAELDLDVRERPPRVGDVVGGAQEAVHVAEGVAAVVVQKDQGKIQIRLAAGGELVPELARGHGTRTPPRRISAFPRTNALSTADSLGRPANTFPAPSSILSRMREPPYHNRDISTRSCSSTRSRIGRASP